MYFYSNAFKSTQEQYVQQMLADIKSAIVLEYFVGDIEALVAQITIRVRSGRFIVPVR